MAFNPYITRPAQIFHTKSNPISGINEKKTLNPYINFSVPGILAPGLAAIVGLDGPVPGILAPGLAAIVGLGGPVPGILAPGWDAIVLEDEEGEKEEEGRRRRRRRGEATHLKSNDPTTWQVGKIQNEESRLTRAQQPSPVV